MICDVKVKNLGRIKEAEFKVRLVTVITGTNGTGKSFFTKSLYSILNVINKNIYPFSIVNLVRQIQLKLQVFSDGLSDTSKDDIIFFKKLTDNLNILETDLNDASNWKVAEYFKLVTSKITLVNDLYDSYLVYFEKNKSKSKPHHEFLDDIYNDLKHLILQVKEPNKFYANLFASQIENELKDNFQISNLSELVNFENKTSVIEIENFLFIELGEKDFKFRLENDFIDEVTSLANVVFFESPAYWKVREALIVAQNRSGFFPVNDVLTGVPKYFYDLDTALNTRSKNASEFEYLVERLENELDGEFIFKAGNLSFKDKQSSKEISKNLMSFGMTNLGMIQALLKQNIVTKGSFVFIDEPETNLHPEWQVILIEVLLELAKHEVNVVIATHSMEILKAIEVGTKKLALEKVNDFLAVHVLDIDGTLLEFDSEDSLEQLAEARGILNSSYSKLYYS